MASGVALAEVVATAMGVELGIAGGAIPPAGEEVTSGAGFGVRVAGLTAVGPGASVAAGTGMAGDDSLGVGSPVHATIVSAVNKATVTARANVNCSSPIPRYLLQFGTFAASIPKEWQRV